MKMFSIAGISRCRKEILSARDKEGQQVEQWRLESSREARAHPPDPTPFSRCKEMVPQGRPEWSKNTFDVSCGPFRIPQWLMTALRCNRKQKVRSRRAQTAYNPIEDKKRNLCFSHGSFSKSRGDNNTTRDVVPTRSYRADKKDSPVRSGKEFRGRKRDLNTRKP